VNKTGSAVQGFAATEEFVRAAIHGSPSLCHPELVSGSGFGESVVGDRRSEVGKSKGSVARCKFQVVSKKT